MTVKESKVVLEVEMTPEEYVAIQHNATWDGKSVAQYIVDYALGRTRKGC